MTSIRVPYFRPSLGEGETAAVADVLRSGWLTTGPVSKHFEEAFATSIGARHSIALNSCTAALHLAVEALGLVAGDAVLVPTMTFAATAEVVRYMGAFPILVDCDPVTGHMSLIDAEAKITRSGTRVTGIMPVHVGGLMIDLDAVRDFAGTHKLWTVEDAAHAFPAAWRASEHDPWQRCGEDTADVTCFSFYANKTITSGEGGMAVCADERVADRMRMMSLHGLSTDAWGRSTKASGVEYEIVAPGFKYNMPDVAAALGLAQLARADALRLQRERIARHYDAEWGGIPQLSLPPWNANRIHSWHLYPVRLDLNALRVTRDEFTTAMSEHGVGHSVHWKPLHLHRYYRETFGSRPEDCPVATALWPSLVSMPIFPGMLEDEIEHVVSTIRRLCRQFAR